MLILENMNYYGPNFWCPSEVKIGPTLRKPVLDWRTGIFSSSAPDYDSECLQEQASPVKYDQTWRSRGICLNLLPSSYM